MANNLKQPIEVSPGVRDSNDDGTPDSNVVGTPYGTVPGTNWLTEWIPVQGTEHGSEELSIMCHVDWQGATFIDLLPQYQHRSAAVPADPVGQQREPAALPITAFDGARLDANFEAELDSIRLLAANFRTDPGVQELALAVAGVSQARFLAQSDGSPVLRIQVLSGGGWRGA